MNIDTLDHLLQRMDQTFTRMTGQTISFIDQSGEWHVPLRLEHFTDFCRCVISSKNGASRCRSCNHAFGLLADKEVKTACCHMGVSVISVPVIIQDAPGLILSYGQFLTQDTQAEFYQRLEANCADLELDHQELKKLAATLRVLSQEEVDARIQLLRLFAAYVSTAEAELKARQDYAQQVGKKLELERRLRSMEFKFLQSQISPHFLFNTLNLLMRTAYRENAGETAELICDLAELLRRAYHYKDSICTLQEEMDCAKKYLVLQSLRLGPELTFSLELSPECGRIMVPVLTIQPLVENAILHGMAGDEHPLRVEVTARLQDGLLIIQITDDGVGIPSDVLEHISGGSGLVNVSERLKLFFGEKAVMKIRSTPGQGTCITLECPTDERQEDDYGDRAADR